MVRAAFHLSASLYYWLHDHAPTNRLVRRLRQHPTLPGVLTALGLGLLLLITAGGLGQAVRAGAPAWLNLGVLWLAWDGVKATVLAPVGLAWWARARIARVLKA